MNTLPSSSNTSRRPSGDFPEPSTAWERPGVLAAEVVIVLAVLAMVLANSMDPGFWQSPFGGGQQASQPMNPVANVTLEARDTTLASE